MNLNSKLPPYLPFARFLLKADLSMTAKIVYSLLLDRMTLSQKSGWADEDGRSYILYPIERIAEDIDRGQTAVKSALTELSAKGLIVRKRIGFDRPNRIYVLLPDGRDAEPPTDGNPPLVQSENNTSDGRKTDGTQARNAAPNHRTENHIKYSQTKREDSLSPFGQYQNVFLSDEEYAALKAEHPQADLFIEQLSAYMKASGKRYADHAAALRIWMAREAPKLPDYRETEGESL